MVTSVDPITNIVKNIGGDKIDLVGIIPEGSDSHTFELVPSDVVKMNDAGLIIIDGLNLEGGMEKVAIAANNKSKDNYSNWEIIQSPKINGYLTLVFPKKKEILTPTSG